ncbi:MAG TPA: GAF domain-containing protein, partial [Thermomicrobiales bacterium]|nr:GAF domain-containing protein [Thermomicrobiales bacterium]
LAASRRDLQDALSATERRNHELRLLSEVGDALNRSFDLDVLLERSLDLVLTAFAAEAGGVILYDDDGETQHWRDRVGEEGQSAVARWAAARAAHPLSLLDLPTPRVYDLGGDQGRIAVAPLRTAVRTQGMLVIFLAPGWQPDERDLDLLEQVGGQIARAAENARLYVAEKDRSAEAGMLAQMAQLTVGTLDLDRLARLIARYAVHVLGVDRCLVGFYDPGGRGALRQIHQYGFPTHQEALGEGEREELQQIVQRYMLASQPLVVSDAQTDDRPEVRALAERLGARSLISVPLVARDRRVGLIYLDTREPRQHTFSPQDQRILAAIADQAAAALDGARLYAAERRRGEQLRVLNAAGRQIVATPALAELFAQVTATVREAFGYESVRVGLIEGHDLAFATGEPDRVPLAGNSPAAWAVRHGQARSSATPLPGSDGVRAILAVPLRTKERIAGALLAESARATPFDDDDERTLASLGDQLGIAIENARLHERALALAVVDERNRLARELHDSVTQTLFSMHLTIEATRTLLGRKGDVAGAEQQLANLSERARETLAEMRALIHSLRPAEMEEQGLVAALTRWTERVRRENLLPVDLRIEGTPDLPEAEEQELFRIAQEALNNTVKHAAATHVTVQLTTGPAAVTLLVEDDGKGFDPAVPLRGNAFGTRGMRERAAILGGTFSIDSHPGGGTRVLITMPRNGAAPSTPLTEIAVTGGEQ